MVDQSVEDYKKLLPIAMAVYKFTVILLSFN